jgi:superfamily II DNA or RNA helicase
VFLTEYLEGVAEQVETVRSEKGLLKTIIFCRNISHLRRVQKHFPNAKPYHSELSAGVREQRLRKFRSGELSEILVVDMFNEAIDIPDADLLVFLRATESETVWRQQLGRGLRRNGDKEKCVVVLDFVANCDRLYMIRSFTKEVEECLSEKEKSAPGLPTAPTGWQVNFTAELIDVVKVLDFLDIDSWEYRYDELKAFHAEHGHCNVPKGWKENPALGTWVSNQRKVYKEGKLSEERTQQLEALGFVWRRIKRKKK